MKFRIFKFDVARKLHRSPARNRTFSLTPRFSGVMEWSSVVGTVSTVLKSGPKLLKQLGPGVGSTTPLKRGVNDKPSGGPGSRWGISGLAFRLVRCALCAVLALSALSHSFAATNDLASTLQRGLFEE